MSQIGSSLQRRAKAELSHGARPDGVHRIMKLYPPWSLNILGTLRPFFFRHRKIQKDLVIDSLSTSTNSVRYSIVHDVGTSSGSRLGESCPKLPKSEEFGELGWTWSRKMPKIGQFSILDSKKVSGSNSLASLVFKKATLCGDNLVQVTSRTLRAMQHVWALGAGVWWANLEASVFKKGIPEHIKGCYPNPVRPTSVSFIFCVCRDGHDARMFWSWGRQISGPAWVYW